MHMGNQTKQEASLASLGSWLLSFYSVHSKIFVQGFEIKPWMIFLYIVPKVKYLDMMQTIYYTRRGIVRDISRVYASIFTSRWLNYVVLASSHMLCILY